MCYRLTKLSVTLWCTFSWIFDEPSLWILPETHDTSLYVIHLTNCFILLLLQLLVLWPYLEYGYNNQLQSGHNMILSHNLAYMWGFFFKFCGHLRWKQPSFFQVSLKKPFYWVLPIFWKHPLFLEIGNAYSNPTVHGMRRPGTHRA